MGFIVKGVKKVVKAVGKIVKGVVGVVSKVVGAVFGFAVGGSKQKTEQKGANNLNKSLEPEAARKIVFGKTAAPLDIRFWEVYGSNSQLYAEVIAIATHKIHSFKELYLEQKLAINASGVIQSPFVGVLTRTTRDGTIGTSALSVGSGSLWNANSVFHGCAHMALHWVPDEKKLPNGIPGRYTQVVEGAPVYDPRRDSTQVGGSGTHRYNDQSTWDYGTLDGNGQPIGRNNALQALWYLLGWRINNAATAEPMLVAGRGVEPGDINFASFIAGANACEAAGYYTDLILSTDDEHTTNEDKITCDGLIGRLIDPGGLWSYYANVDDTANIAVELTDADILDGVAVNWNEFKGMSEQFNSVGGKYVNGSAVTLYQAFPYPPVRDATYEANLGIKKRRTQDFEQVLDYQLAQRLARLKLNEGQYQGEFSAAFMARAIKAQAWSVVRYTSERFGWTKLFRVWRHDISTDGGVGMLLKEIHASIWSAGSVAAALTHGQGNGYDPSAEIVVAGLAGQQATITGPGTNPTIVDAAIISWTAPPENVRRTEVRYKLNGTTYWETAAPVQRGAATAIAIFPLVRAGVYNVEVRHVSVHEVPGPWAAMTFTAGSSGNVTYAGIQAAASTADASSITDGSNGTVPRTNILTSLGISSGFTGQGGLATLNTVAGGQLLSGGSLEGLAVVKVDRADGGAVSIGGYSDVNGAFHGSNFIRLMPTGGHAFFFNNAELKFVAKSAVVTVSMWVKDSGVANNQHNSGVAGAGGVAVGLYDTVAATWHYPAATIPTGTGYHRVTYTKSDCVPGRTYVVAIYADAYMGNRAIDIDALQAEYGQAATNFSPHVLEDGANRTESRIASSVAGQGWLATQNVVQLGTTGGAYRVLDESGNSGLVNANVITSQGTAAGIAGQGTLATRNNAQWGTATLADVPYQALLRKNLIRNTIWRVGHHLPTSNGVAAGGVPNPVETDAEGYVYGYGAGASASNYIQLLNGPRGVLSPVLRSLGQGSHSDGGAFYQLTKSSGYHPGKSYRFSVWIKRPASYTIQANQYFGCYASNSEGVYNLGGLYWDTNPYFNYINAAVNLTADKWYLWVGMVHGYNHYDGAMPVQNPPSEGGIYDPETGAKVFGCNDFVSHPNTVALGMRFFNYDNGVGHLMCQWAEPMVEEVSGEMPSVQAILADARRTSNLTTSGRANTLFSSAADGKPFGKVVGAGEAGNGEVISFGQTFAQTPRIIFLPGGLAPNAGANIAVRADYLSPSGFTMKATQQTVTAGALQTMSGSVAGGGGDPQRVIDRTSAVDPYDNKYKYTYSGSVPDLRPGEPGQMQVSFWMKRGGVWVQVGTDIFSSASSVTRSKFFTGPADNAGGYEFGMSISSQTGGGSIGFQA